MSIAALGLDLGCAKLVASRMPYMAWGELANLPGPGRAPPIRSTVGRQPCEASVSLVENHSVAGADRRKDRAGGPDGCAGRGHGDACPGLGQLRRPGRATELPGCADTRPPGLSYCPATARACATVSTRHPEAAASVNIGSISYRARCTEA